MKKRLLTTLLTSSLLLVSLTACNVSSTQSTSKTPVSKTVKTCFVTQKETVLNSEYEKQISSLGKNAVKETETKLKTTIKTYELDSKTPDETIKTALEDKCDTFVGAGETVTKVLQTQAEKNTKLNFISLTGDFDGNLANTKNVVYTTAELGFLSGYLAASMTRTGILGVFADSNSSTNKEYATAFENGVYRYNSEQGTAIQVLGFSKGKLLTVSEVTETSVKKTVDELMSKKADIVLPLLGEKVATVSDYVIQKQLGSSASQSSATDTNGSSSNSSSDGSNTADSSEGDKNATSENSSENTQNGQVILTPNIHLIYPTILNDKASELQKKTVLASVKFKFDSVLTGVLKQSMRGFNNENYVASLKNDGLTLRFTPELEKDIPQPVKESIRSIIVKMIKGKISWDS